MIHKIEIANGAFTGVDITFETSDYISLDELFLVLLDLYRKYWEPEVDDSTAYPSWLCEEDKKFQKCIKRWLEHRGVTIPKYKVLKVDEWTSLL